MRLCVTVGAVAIVTLLGLQSSAPAAGGHVTLETFAGNWGGHDRGLSITRSGRGNEEISSGCCDYVVKLRFHLSNPRGTLDRALATES